MKRQRGQAFILVLILLAVGALMITPVLNYLSTALRSQRISEKALARQYIADSAVEDALWRLLYESGFAESMTPENPVVEYSINISGTEVPVTVTKFTGLGADTLSLDADYVVPAGHLLEFRITVSDDDHCHLAYDTVAYDSWLQIPTTSGTLTYYLHNNPTPPTGDTDAQANLHMDEVQPTATNLYNYDQNYDSNVGRRIEESEGGPDGLELKEYQNWQTEPYGSDIHLQGTVIVNLLVAPDGFNYDNEGEFTVYLRDYDPASGTYTEIANATYQVDENQWVQPWHSTAPEGKYEIHASAGGTQVDCVVALGFGYIRVLSFTNGGG